MINQQLVDYIKQQMQAGVAKDAVKKALGDAGWPAADVDDSMKAAEPAAGASPAAATINPVVAMGGMDPGPAKSASSASSFASPSSSDKFFSKSPASKPAASEAAISDGSHSARKYVIGMIVMGAVILLLAGALAFVYFSLSGQVSTAQQGNGGTSAEVATLQNSVSQLTKSNGDLTAQVQSLTAANQTLSGELGFFVPTAATAGSSTVISATVSGMLSGNASSTFVLTTTDKVRVIVANTKDAKVSAALTPLANGSSTVSLAGTHAPASLNLTVTAVNGTTL